MTLFRKLSQMRGGGGGCSVAGWCSFCETSIGSLVGQHAGPGTSKTEVSFVLLEVCDQTTVT